MTKIDDDFFTAEWEWSSFKINAVQELIEDWICKYEIFNAESVFQTDDGIVESSTLVAKILEVLDIKVVHK